MGHWQVVPSGGYSFFEEKRPDLDCAPGCPGHELPSESLADPPPDPVLARLSSEIVAQLSSLEERVAGLESLSPALSSLEERVAGLESLSPAALEARGPQG